MQTIERELPRVQPLPSVKDHLLIGGLQRLFPASVLTGGGATGSKAAAGATVRRHRVPQPPGGSGGSGGRCYCSDFMETSSR